MARLGTLECTILYQAEANDGRGSVTPCALVSIIRITKPTVRPCSTMPRPHERYLLLLGSFYSGSKKQTKSIAVNFSHQSFSFSTGKKKKSCTQNTLLPTNKKEHIFASYIVKSLG